MKKILSVLFFAIFLGGCTPKDLFVKAPAGLEVSSVPESTVFIDGESKGQTPFKDDNLKPGTYTLKLVPVSSDFLPYETSIELVSKTSTIISRNFALSDLETSGYTLELQEDLSGGTFLSVISDPDNINLFIDDSPSGFTPVSKMAISPGPHTLKATSPGYIDQTLPINTVTGFNLIVNFKLASRTITLTPPPVATATATTSPAPDESASPSPSTAASSSPKASLAPTSEVQKPYVIVGETGTGWLRIRKEASGSSDELGKANTGEKLKYLGESTELGWFKVEFDGNVGWVSGKYVTLVN